MKQLSVCLIGMIGLIMSGPATAGTITTVADIQANGGVTLDSAGDIYAADFGPFGAPQGPRNIWKVSPSGAFAPFIFANGIIVASGNDFDSQDNLYQSNFGGNRISRIDPAGNVTTFSTSVNGPVGIVIDDNDTLFVSNCSGNTIGQITAQGVASTYSTSGLYNCPNGITRDTDGNLYVINFNGGRIYKVDTNGTPTLFAAVGSPGGHVTISGGRLFATSFGQHEVTAFTLSGTNAGTELFTIGNGQNAGVDGSFTTGGFSAPNGITVDATGQILYVTDDRGVRRIDLEDPGLVLSRTSIDFGGQTVGASANETLDISNNGVGDLFFSAIVLTAAPDVSITLDTCTGTSLANSESCSLTLSYTPQAAGTLDTLLNITSNDPILGVVAMSVTGSAVTVPAPNLVDPGDIDFGDLMFGDTTDVSLPLENNGVLPLNIASVLLVETAGAPASATTESFSVTQTCAMVAVGATCQETLSFHPVSAGAKSATLAIVSDDPDTPSLEIMISGTASTDSDGVPDAIEDGGPNTGDGNSDGTADSGQPDVASLPDTNGVYLTVVSVDNLSLVIVAAVVNPSPGDSPTNANFDQGVVAFSITGVPTTAISVDLILAVGTTAPDQFFNYGGEPANTADHWYDFTSDGTTGASFNGNTVSLALVDGGRGDADQIVNGTIVFLGGSASTPPPPPPPPPPPSASGGGGGGTFGPGLLLFLGLLPMFRRRWEI